MSLSFLLSLSASEWAVIALIVAILSYLLGRVIETVFDL